jgi:hypothetical protein
MQINLFHPVIKKVIPWVGWVLFIICLLIKCDNEKETITIPEVIGGGKPITEIVHVPVNVPVEVPKWYKDTKKEKELNDSLKARQKRIKLYEEEVAWMQEEFAYMDSVQKAQAYKEATSLKNFSAKYEDDKIEIAMQGIVRGEVKEISPFYRIKEQKVDIPASKNRLLLGFGAGTNFELSQFTAKTNLSLQNKKGNIYTLSYQRMGQQNFGLIEYNFTLIK